MSRRLVVLNLLFLVLGIGAVVAIVREVTQAPTRPAVRSRAATSPAQPAPPPAAGQPVPPGGYTAVAARNLFSPTRTETPAVTAAQLTRPVPPPVKPNLQGVVLRDGAPIAYMQDPTTKRTAGYRLGDSIAGGTVQAIHADRVVLARPDGNIDVRLHDPSKPRPAPQAAPAVMPRVPVPGAIPGTVMPSQDPSVVPPSVQPGIQPQVPGFPQRRPLPPSLLRRLPPPTSDAAQQ